MTAAAATEAHVVSVVWKGGRYPHQPVCSCGWSAWGYVAVHAAQILADDHAATPVPLV